MYGNRPCIQSLVNKQSSYKRGCVTQWDYCVQCLCRIVLCLQWRTNKLGNPGPVPAWIVVFNCMEQGTGSCRLILIFMPTCSRVTMFTQPWSYFQWNLSPNTSISGWTSLVLQNSRGQLFSWKTKKNSHTISMHCILSIIIKKMGVHVCLWLMGTGRDWW